MADHITAAEEMADMIIVGGQVVTLDPRTPSCEAVAIREGKILRLGTGAEIEALADPQTQRLQLNGEFVIPGLIESHGHFVGLGQARMMLDLSSAKSWEEIVDLVGKAAQHREPGEWILGRGWHQSKWRELPADAVQEYPSHTQLSAVTPAHPVLLTHASGHMAVVNARAMQLAKIQSAADPDGGEILRDVAGLATGVLRETAQRLVSQLADRFRESPEQLSTAIQLAGEECSRHGITSFQDAGSSFQVAERLRQAAEDGELPVRLWVMIRESNDRLRAQMRRFRVVGGAQHFFTVRAIKRSLDGALGSHGAWLLEPYDDLPSSVGLNTYPVSALEETARLALETDCQLCVHAIGDRANRETLDVFAAAFESQPSQLPRRWRIEHAQHLHPDDIPRFAQLGVIAAMQGIHCTSDAIFVTERLGQRRAQQGAYVWRDLLDSGARIANGTDVPVESIDPIACFYASVTRKLPNGVAFYPRQAMTREEALRSYTLDAAYAAFEEELKGSLTPGKLADITILSHNLLTCSEEELLTARVVVTIVDGQIVFQRDLP